MDESSSIEVSGLTLNTSLVMMSFAVSIKTSQGESDLKKQMKRQKNFLP
jgi:hypothetical protein